jgi:L-ascorbate metabolism protein UlaG (beta-lactamase superfamily)
MMTLAIALTLLAVVPGWSADKFPAAGGDVEITPIVHSSVQVEHGGKVIQVDPWRPGDYATAKPADLILVTDIQNDHLDVETIAKIRKSGAPVLIPAAAKDKFPEGTAIANGETTTVAGIRVEVVASYDLLPGDPFHPKGRANGYIVTLGGQRVYFAGVSECTPEMKALKNIDIAFVSVYLPNERMTPTAAADCMKTFRPKVVYPYHFRTGKIQLFKDALKGEPIDVRLPEWYPGGKGLGGR